MNCEWWQGWRAGENIAIEYRGAEDQTKRLPAFAAEFIDASCGHRCFGLPTALQP
jgi:hypothetical protein